MHDLWNRDVQNSTFKVTEKEVICANTVNFIIAVTRKKIFEKRKVLFPLFNFFFVFVIRSLRNQNDCSPPDVFSLKIIAEV